MYLMRPSPARAPSGATSEMVRAQLQRILASAVFAGSPRLSRFLEFVVERARQGLADGLKEYAIGLEVFERASDFDPRIDPIVRVQAAKLRSKLMEYYNSDGCGDALVISVPKGGYVPLFECPAVAPPKPAPPVESVRPSLAVLPFVNMSPEPDNEYFSDGLTEEVINALTSVPGLQVVARTSVFRFKGRHQDVREIGSQLNAGAILEGSVRKLGVQLRITAQLINVKDGYHLWSHTFKREMKDVFEVQEEISAAVREALTPFFGGAPLRPQHKPNHPNPQAHELYLRGRYAQARLIRGSVAQGIQLFEQAIAADPGYARAYAGLADAWFLLAFWGVVAPHTAMPKAKAPALRALELDDQLPEAYASLGVIQTSYEWQWKEGERNILRALELDPDLGPGYQALASQIQLPTGRLNEAIETQRKVIALDPLSPNPQATLTFLLGLSGQIREAVAQHQSTLATNPSYFFAHSTMAIAYSSNGMTVEALEEITKTFEAAQGHSSILSGMAYFHAQNGNLDRAREFLCQALQAAETSYIPAIDIAAAWSGLRDREQALAWLHRALEERSTQLFFLPMDPRHRWLHGDPAFTAVLDRLGLPLVRVKS